MTEADVLNRDIDTLMVQQRDAWRELARPTLTIFDRREIRNRIRQSEAELRYCLKIRTDGLSFRPQPAAAGAVKDSLAELNFRLF
jgi:hypothetical protein